MIKQSPAALLVVFLAIAAVSCSKNRDFAGTYSGDGIELTLEKNATGYEGTLRFKGKEHAVVATASGDRLTGTFAAGEKKFDFSADAGKDGLTLSSGGATYQLTGGPAKADENPLAKSADSNPLAGNSGESAEARDDDDDGDADDDDDGRSGGGASFSGQFAGTGPVSGAVAQLAQQGDEVTGAVRMQGYQYQLTASVDGGSGSGNLTDPQMGGRIPVTLEVNGDELVITLTVPGNPPQPLTFRRGGAGAAPPETASNESDSGGERDARLVGSWSRTDTLSSGDTHLSTKMYLQIQGNGTFSMTTGRSAGGGPGWGAGSGGGETVSGRWQTRGGIVYVSDGGPFNAYAKYYVEANKLMFTFGNGSREIWYR